MRSARPNARTPTGRRRRLGRDGAGGLRVGERYLTQVQAARAAGVSRDTIIRARRAGRLAGCRLVDGRWLVPASSLAASGLGPGLASEPEPVCIAPDPEPEDGVGSELAAAQARLAALTDLVARQDEELRFLRRLLADAVAKRGAG
ncbi:MAG TPA: helix-turn-helix domain-containing protein [Acidimicrobiales bacterium]|nr:helix-turn-helix domain-containing protein [Acidimicrobiales bacterium]